MIATSIALPAIRFVWVVESVFVPIQAVKCLFAVEILYRIRPKCWSSTSMCCWPPWIYCTRRYRDRVKWKIPTHSVGRAHWNGFFGIFLQDALAAHWNRARPQYWFLRNTRKLDSGWWSVESVVRTNLLWWWFDFFVHGVWLSTAKRYGNENPLNFIKLWNRLEFTTTLLLTFTTLAFFAFVDSHAANDSRSNTIK